MATPPTPNHPGRPMTGSNAAAAGHKSYDRASGLRAWLKKQYLADIQQQQQQQQQLPSEGDPSKTPAVTPRIHTVMGKMMMLLRPEPKAAVEAWHEQPLKLVSLAVLMQEVVNETLAEQSKEATLVEERVAWARAVEVQTVKLLLAERQDPANLSVVDGANDKDKLKMPLVAGLDWDWESSSGSEHDPDNSQVGEMKGGQ